MTWSQNITKSHKKKNKTDHTDISQLCESTHKKGTVLCSVTLSSSYQAVLHMCTSIVQNKRMFGISNITTPFVWLAVVGWILVGIEFKSFAEGPPSPFYVVKSAVKGVQ